MQVSARAIAEIISIHRALADETRARIAPLLFTVGELCVREVETALDISQSKASRHLTALKLAGLVNDHRSGPWVYYRVADGLPEPARTALEKLARATAPDGAVVRDRANAQGPRRSPRCTHASSRRAARTMKTWSPTPWPRRSTESRTAWSIPPGDRHCLTGGPR